MTADWRQTACGRGIAGARRAGEILALCCDIELFCFLLGGDESFFGVAVILGLDLRKCIRDRVKQSGVHLLLVHFALLSYAIKYADLESIFSIHHSILYCKR